MTHWLRGLPALAFTALTPAAWAACPPNQPNCQEHAPPAQQFQRPSQPAPQFHPQQAPPQQFHPQQVQRPAEQPPPFFHPQQAPPQQFHPQQAPPPQQFHPQQVQRPAEQPPPFFHPQQPPPQQFQRPAQQQPPQFEQQHRGELQRTPPPMGFRPAPSAGAPPLRAPEQGRSFQGRAPERDERGRAYVYRGERHEPFRAEPYRWPHGTHYEHYRVGSRLPLAFIISSFIIADWAAYDLAPPPYGYQWVRYGPDMLLVDPNTGLIADGAYSAFADSPDGYDSGGPPPGYYSPPPNNQPEPLGTYGSWSAAMYQENGQDVCYAFTPSQNAGGQVMLTVTERLSGRDMVSISAGAPLPPNMPITVLVDQAALEFYGAGSVAYARDGAEAASAFRSGNRAELQLPDSAPASFSLIGFSAAYAAINRACP